MLGNNLLCTGMKVEESVKYLHYTSLVIDIKMNKSVFNITIIYAQWRNLAKSMIFYLDKKNVKNDSNLKQWLHLKN